MILQPKSILGQTIILRCRVKSKDLVLAKTVSFFSLFSSTPDQSGFLSQPFFVLHFPLLQHELHTLEVETMVRSKIAKADIFVNYFSVNNCPRVNSALWTKFFATCHMHLS